MQNQSDKSLSDMLRDDEIDALIRERAATNRLHMYLTMQFALAARPGLVSLRDPILNFVQWKLTLEEVDHWQGNWN